MSSDETDVSEAALRSLFSHAQDAFRATFDQLNYAEVHQLALQLLNCRGVVLFSGVGKSGFVARKVSQTLVSTGTRAIFLAPVDALHGDIGIVQSGDLLVLLSKTGDSSELTELVPYARVKGARIIAITADASSALAKVADFHCTLPRPRRLDEAPAGAEGGAEDGPRQAQPPAPPLYTAMQLLLGDTVVVALMHAKKLTREQYAMNHPAGRIGKRLVLRVRDIMKASELPCCSRTQNGLAALVQLAGSSKGCGCLLVVDDTRQLCGTLSDGDLRRALAASGEAALTLTVSELMNFNKPFPRFVCPDEMAYDALLSMEQKPPVTYMPVLRSREDRTLEGLVTIHDCVNAGLY